MTYIPKATDIFPHFLWALLFQADSHIMLWTTAQCHVDNIWEMTPHLFTESDNGAAFHKPHADLGQNTRKRHTAGIPETTLFVMLSWSFLSQLKIRDWLKKRQHAASYEHHHLLPYSSGNTPRFYTHETKSETI